MASSLGGKNPVPKGAVKDRVNFYESVSEDTRSSGSGGLRRSKSELTLHHNSDINNEAKKEGSNTTPSVTGYSFLVELKETIEARKSDHIPEAQAIPLDLNANNSVVNPSKGVKKKKSLGYQSQSTRTGAKSIQNAVPCEFACLEDLQKIKEQTRDQLKTLELCVQSLQNISEGLHKNVQLLETPECTLKISDNSAIVCLPANFHQASSGTFLKKENISVYKPREFEAVIFIFEEILILTVPSKNNGEYVYVDSIPAAYLEVNPYTGKSETIVLKHKSKCLRANAVHFTYEIKTQSMGILIPWLSKLNRIHAANNGL